MRHPGAVAALSGIVLACSLSACFLLPPKDRPEVCTAEFRTFGVYVLTPSGRAVALDDVAVTAEHIGAVPICPLEPSDSTVRCLSAHPERGWYEVMNDALGEDLRRSGNDVLFSGLLGDTSIRATFRFRWDGCHAQKLAGPDTLIVQ